MLETYSLPLTSGRGRDDVAGRLVGTLMTEASAAPRLFYGWVVVAIAFLTMAVAVSARTGFSLLYPELLDEFGWDRGATAGAYSLGFVASTTMLPLVGWMMDRWGPRVVVPIGAFLVSSGLALTVLIESIVGLYATMGLLVVNGSMAMSYIVHSMFLPNWFVRNRGLAVGVAFAGVGIGGAVLLPAMQWVIDVHGWRAACLAMAGLILLLIVPLNAVFQRGHPAPMGLEPDGGPGRGQSGPPPDPIVDHAWTETEWTVARAIRTWRFWMVSTAFFCGLFCWYAYQAHQTTFLIDAGFDAGFAATALGAVALGGVICQIGTGALSDRFGREVAWTFTLSGLAATAVLFIWLGQAPSVWLVWTMVVVQGCLGNGLSVLFGAVITEIFQGPRLASIFALISLCGNVGAGVGAWMLGWLFDLTGSYDPGFGLCLGLALLSIACMWVASPRKVRLVAGQAARRAIS